jgi:hypothetical protein
VLAGSWSRLSGLTHRLQQQVAIERSTQRISRQLITSSYDALAQRRCGGRSADASLGA